MNANRSRNDRVATGPAIPGPVLHLLLPVTAALAALLIPVIGWQFATVGLALVGMLLPQSLGGWLSIGCLAIGMLLAEPGTWQAMLAVFAVHMLHVLSSLLPVIPWRGRVVIVALWPTLRRLILVQLIAQPATFIVMLVHESGTTAIGGAALVGAAALAVFAVAFLIRAGRHSTTG